MGEMADNDAFYAELLENSLVQKSQASTICKRCHVLNLQWVLTRGKWKLVNKDGTPHVCMAHKKRRTKQ